MIIRPVVFVLMLLLSACGDSPTVPVDHFYRFTLNPGIITSQPLSDKTIFVSKFLAEGIYNERALLFSEDEDNRELQQYHYHFWAVAPSSLLRDYLVDYLRAADSAPVVVGEFSAGEGLKIGGRILGFEKLKNTENSSIHVVLEIRLDKLGEFNPRLIKTYKALEKINGKSMDDTIAAFNRAVDRIFADFIADAARKLQ
jgi:ABC-type uncharacterized transport system auxiliary subunit